MARRSYRTDQRQPEGGKRSGRSEPPPGEEDAQQLARDHPGALAGSPQEIPLRGWWEVLRRGWQEFKIDQMPLIAAGVAYYGFLAIVPTLIAATLLYGLVTSPEEVQRQVSSFATVLPEPAQQVLSQQLTTLANSSHRGLGIGVVVSLVGALWSASGGAGNLASAITVAYDQERSRGFVKGKALSFVLTIGMIVFFALAATLVAVFPAIANALHPPTPVRIGLELLRWLAVLIVITFALAVLYRVAPNRDDDPRFRWVSPGAGIATLLWLLASIGLSIYVENFGKYSSTYGSLAGVVVLLLWLWLGAYAVLLGAEINAEAEKQTIRDTTRGADQPRGKRGAVKADEGPTGTQ